MAQQFINEVLDLTNQYRAQAGLSPLVLNQQLNQAAQSHTENMANQDFVDHTDREGLEPSDRVRKEGYDYSVITGIAENWAAGASSPEQVVRGWMNSPGHRQNILNGNFQEIGIGYDYLANDTGEVNLNHYWTQVFGTPTGNRTTPVDSVVPSNNERGDINDSNLGNESLDKGSNFNVAGDLSTNSPLSNEVDRLSGKNMGSSLVNDDLQITSNMLENPLIERLNTRQGNYENLFEPIENSYMGTSESIVNSQEIDMVEDFIFSFPSNFDSFDYIP